MSRRTAAALMITRGEGRDRQVYLAERAPELRFFGGYWAMPGGTIADEDLLPRSGDEPLDEDAALQVCAHRELFEELGLLHHRLPMERRDPDHLREQRKRLLAHERDDRDPKPPSPWPEIVAGTSTPLAMRALCRIETPAFAPVRYDTVFFHVPLRECTAGTAGVHPDVWEGELTQGRFWLPQQALASWRNGDLLLVPPVVILLEHLAAAADFEHFARSIAATANRYREGDLHKVRFSPGVVLAPLRTPTLPPATTTNCYIVGHERLWIVDPGSPDPNEQQRLLDLLDRLTADGQQLAGVLLTHHHPDHVGGVHALCKSRNLVACGHPRTLERIAPGIPRGDALEDGARIPLGRSPDGKHGWHLEAIHTPGHDQGHLCFRESRYGAMLVGDMMSTISTIIIDPPEGHLATYLQSLEKIERYAMTTLYPAHGPALRDGRRLVQKYLRHRRQREATLVKVLGEQPGDLDELLPKVYWDADPRLYPFAARSLQAGLEKLAEEGRAGEQDGVWRLLG
ncbi:MAG: MBL fold metallo-hydrolase [Planctomycetes bacterium]|nr:MBL fold metallo-hydrolase [Planctomycetota bacterium]